MTARRYRTEIAGSPQGGVTAYWSARFKGERPLVADSVEKLAGCEADLASLGSTGVMPRYFSACREVFGG